MNLDELAAKYALDKSVIDDLSNVINAQIKETVDMQVAEQVAAKVKELTEANAKVLEDQQKALEAELTVQAEEAAKLFAQENKDALVQTEQYHELRTFVDSIVDAFAKLGISEDALGVTRELGVKNDELVKEVADLRAKLQAVECAEYLATQLTESNLSLVQQENIKSTMTFITGKTLNEYKVIVDKLLESEKAKTSPDDANAKHKLTEGKHVYGASNNNVIDTSKYIFHANK